MGLHGRVMVGHLGSGATAGRVRRREEYMGCGCPYHALSHERFEDSRHVLLGVLARRVGEEERGLAHASVTFDSGKRRGSNR